MKDIYVNCDYIICQAVVDTSAQRLVILAKQWDKHREPLIQQYRELKDLNSKKEVSCFSWFFMPPPQSGRRH